MLKWHLKNCSAVSCSEFSILICVNAREKHCCQNVLKCRSDNTKCHIFDHLAQTRRSDLVANLTAQARFCGSLSLWCERPLFTFCFSYRHICQNCSYCCLVKDGDASIRILWLVSDLSLSKAHLVCFYSSSSLRTRRRSNKTTVFLADAVTYYFYLEQKVWEQILWNSCKQLIIMDCLISTFSTANINLALRFPKCCQHFHMTDTNIRIKQSTSSAFLLSVLSLSLPHTLSFQA